MKRIAPIYLKFVYTETEESKRRVSMAYARIFELARKKMAIASSSTEEYIEHNGSGVPDARGSGRNDEGQSDYNLPDVPGRKDTGCEIRKDVEDKQYADVAVVTRKGD